VSDPDEGAPEIPLLALRDGLTDVVDSRASLDQVIDAFRSGSGPIAIDAERASGYRYSQRAYLIQIRREGSGTSLVDPIAFEDLDELNDAFGHAEWILHAASQDLACLREVGLAPTTLFDTELAARLLGYPRVGLATLVETILGHSMRKEHSAVDWSQRPLPQPWLEYAALDVEVLVELRDILHEQLQEQDKLIWAEEEFDHLINMRPTPRVDPWRRTSGIHKVKNRRALAAVKELWTARDQLAQKRDTTPGRLIPDSAIIVAATSLPASRHELLETKGFHGRGAKRFVRLWAEALDRARELPESELPSPARRNDAPPQMRTWIDRDPESAAQVLTAKSRLQEFSDARQVPIENLLTPDYLRRVIWRPPTGAGDLETAIKQALTDLGARPWQVQITAPMITSAIEDPDPLPKKEPPKSPGDSSGSPAG